MWAGTEKPSLAPSLNAKLFQLYLNGKDCEEIRRLNPQLSLGEIVAAKVQGDWEQRRKDHLDRLLNETSQRVEQASLETADFVCDLLTVANREHGDRLRRYIQTGDEKELGEFRIGSIKALKEAIEVLQKLTGQEQQRVVRVHGDQPIVEKPHAPSAVEAASGLKLLLHSRK